jgi:hypothetical protein
MKQSFPILQKSEMHELTPKKHLSPISLNPEIVTFDDIYV